MATVNFEKSTTYIISTLRINNRDLSAKSEKGVSDRISENGLRENTEVGYEVKSKGRNLMVQS
jgi:hypothetical protein